MMKVNTFEFLARDGILTYPNETSAATNRNKRGVGNWTHLSVACDWYTPRVPSLRLLTGGWSRRCQCNSRNIIICEAVHSTAWAGADHPSSPSL